MAQSMSRGGGRFMVGEYVVGKQIGSGSFSTVWHARHRVHGTEVAIKEIVMGRLNNKLQESLKLEIVILKKINHPNIIRLLDMIEESGKIYIILEYCRGGDLSVYIQQRQGRIPEATAKHFMQHLASGLKILRDNNLIHRDLKPQNLLLSANDENSTLKIADFGFARSLQPRGLAETLCGSPLYMAPEIMQLQKYDAKADLWSVGAILFQLVTGRTPFTGNNQIQLLQNIIKSTDLHFPPDLKDLSHECKDLCQKLLRRNPVERLTFEEFFNHPFLSSEKEEDEIFRNRRSPQRVIDGFTISEDSSQKDSLPFILDNDDDNNSKSKSKSKDPSPIKKSPLRTTYGFSLHSKDDSVKTDHTIITHKPVSIGSNLGNRRLSQGNLNESLKSKVTDSLELIDDYVLVPGPQIGANIPKLSSFPPKPLVNNNITSTSSHPVRIIGAPIRKEGNIVNLESQSFSPKTQQGSFYILDNLEQPSTDYLARIKSLKRSAAAIFALVKEKSEEKRHLESFSIQLVILAIWKQALDICHTQAASVIKEEANNDILTEIEKRFLLEVGNAEELSKAIEPGATEMPDAMETIYQAALDLGKHGAVKEYMGDVENAEVAYSKAVCLFVFLLVEAPSLIINPPFALTNSDRFRIKSYIDLLTNRHSVSRSQKMALLKAGDKLSSS